MRHLVKTFARSAVCLVIALVYAAVSLTIWTAPASADSPYSSTLGIANNAPWYNPDFKACAQAAAAGGPTAASATQVEIAKIVMGVAKTLGLGQRGALIGLMTALAESGLKNYANSGVPISMQNPAWLALPEPRPLGRDHDSVGVFQQRVSTGWSTIKPAGDPAQSKELVYQLMTPAYAAQAFFGAPPGSDAPAPLSRKGLQHVRGWQTMSPWLAAQRVQVSFDDSGNNYRVKMPAAQSLLNQHWESAPAVALPVPITGGAPIGGQAGTIGPNTTCPTSTVNCDNPDTAASNLSPLRQNVVCLATKELELWTTGQMKPGTCAANPDSCFFKYSQSVAEDWCADFISWIYMKANYPLRPMPNWRVANTVAMAAIGQENQKFKYHDAKGYTPVPGDIVYYQYPAGNHHMNIVTEVKGGVITVIGGNQVTNDFTTSKVSSYTLANSTASNAFGYISPE